MIDHHEIHAEEVVALICNSDNTAEAFALYQLAAPLLKDYKFVFASDKGATPGFAVNRTFSAGAAVRSLFETERVLVLDAETVAEMESGPATYPIDYSISLDTNAMSYLVPYVTGKRARSIPADFQEVFEFIARSDVHVDPLPYLLENLPRLASGESADKIFENLKSYEVLRTIDIHRLKSKGEVRSTLSDEELAAAAQRQISKMYLDIENRALMESITSRHLYFYACLIKIAAIQLKAPSTSLSKKMAVFLEFCHSTLATMSIREAAVARAYFVRGQGLKFFGKIQKNSKNDILKLLRNMAWDMWHIRQLEQSITYKPSKPARYFFPALLTFDRNLIEIMALYPLKACAFKIGTSQPMPFFDGDPFKIIAIDDEEGASAMTRYFSAGAIAARDAARGSVRNNITVVVKSLETELLAVANN
ncbi:hypothetical protein N7373_07335 [Achromobacter mucicolens]|uniref:hypothetical protein n=1 Tax=Achromobacter mucicolens TaxID=1389922 RepID=UPI0024497929|nr:hypothetical protein [Achromobacter mucicolens]MDH0091253.1 hypothetical protein [Achromobacter mucicolens]